MSSLGVFLHDPDATSLYTVEWADWLDGASIANAAWSISPAGPAISSPSISGTVAKCLLAGVEAGKFYTLTCRVTTSTNVIEDRSITIRGGSR